MVSEKQLKELGIEDWSELAKAFKGADLLLGNGFSINLEGHFNYKSLFEEFLELCTPSDHRIFSSFKTHNFERIQEILTDAKRVNELFNITKANRRIDDAIEFLKSGLIKSIRNNHPRSSKINQEQLQRLSTQLNNFGDIFTLNYDLFLYHIILKMKDKSDKEQRIAPYSDYFWGEYDERFQQFMKYDDYPRNHVYYLHGALFLFRIPPEDILKLRRGGAPQELIEMIGEAITRGRMPLFVSEGKYKEKLESIKRSNYLSFCYEKLEQSENKLVIFGSSLSGQDAHIADAINYKKNKRELAISIYIDNKSKDKLEEKIKRLKKKFKLHKIYFLDSKTVFDF